MDDQPEDRAKWDAIFAAKDYPATQILLLRRLLTDQPDSPLAWLILGNQLSETSQFAEAEVALRRALELYVPNRRRLAMLFMGRMFQYKGELGEAETWYRLTIDTFPDDTSAYIYLGAMLARIGRLDDAERFHRAAIGCSEGCIDEAFHNLGLIFRARGKFDDAINFFGQAIALDPDYGEAKQAREDVEQCLKLSKSNGVAE